MKICRYLLFVLLSLMLKNCHEDTRKKEQLLYGNWVMTSFKRTNPGNGAYVFPNGYSFYKNGMLKQGPGFYKFNISDSIHFRYKGSFSKFRVDGDSLRIYNTADKKWGSEYLQKLSPDKMILRSENLILSYDKIRLRLKPADDFDAVIVSNEPCFGSCQIDQTYISRSGDFWYNGAAYTEDIGLFHGCVTPKEFLRFEYEFKLANYSRLKEFYSVGDIDMSAKDLTFIKNGKIVKHIFDYGNASPSLLQITSTTLSDYHALKNMDKVKQPLRFPSFSQFKHLGNYISISTSQSFYLYLLFSQAKEVKIKKNLPYTFGGALDKATNYRTDGRYFLIHTNGKPKTIDIGFNFITANKQLQWIPESETSKQ